MGDDAGLGIKGGEGDVCYAYYEDYTLHISRSQYRAVQTPNTRSFLIQSWNNTQSLQEYQY